MEKFKTESYIHFNFNEEETEVDFKCTKGYEMEISLAHLLWHFMAHGVSKKDMVEKVQGMVETFDSKKDVENYCEYVMFLAMLREMKNSKKAEEQKGPKDPKKGRVESAFKELLEALGASIDDRLEEMKEDGVLDDDDE